MNTLLADDWIKSCFEDEERRLAIKRRNAELVRQSLLEPKEEVKDYSVLVVTGALSVAITFLSLLVFSH